MANQIVVSAGAKVRNLSGVLTATSGVVSFLPIDVSLGIPQLDVNGKILVSQLPNSVMEYKGTWDISTNTPTLVNGTGNQGDVYLVEGAAVGGTSFNFGAGGILFFNGDQAIYSGSIWQRGSGATGSVTSISITESGDSLNITGSPITTSGTINIGFNGTNLQYVNGAGNLTTFPILTGYVPYTGATGDVNLGLYSLTSNSIKVIGDNSTYGGTLSIKQSNVTNLTGVGYTELFGKTNRLGISFGAGSIAYLSNSTLTAERTYTFPDATGTIALTSDLNGYVPYSGATLSLDLGIYSYNGNNVIINGNNSTQNGTLLFKQVGALAFNSVGYSGVGILGTTSMHFNFNQSSGVYKQFNFSVSSLTNNTLRTLNIPDASGTIALTSDLSAYVTLAGTETITGAKTFSGLTSFTNTSGINLQYGAYINKGNTPLAFSSGNTNIYSDATTNNIVIRDNLSIAKLEFNNSTQTYTFPAATGTIALTSDLTGGTVTSVAALTIGTTGTDLSSTVANSTTTPVITLNVPTASAVNRGALSSADWTTFNNKQSALTNPVTGTGTTNYLPKFTGASTIGNSLVYDNGTNVGIGTTSLFGALKVKAGTNQNISINSFSGITHIEAINDANDADVPLRIDATRYEIMSGNFLINTTTDAGYKLDVNGTGRFTGSVLISGATIPFTIRRSAISGQEAAIRYNTNGTDYFYAGLSDGTNNYRLYNTTTGNNDFVISASTGAATFSSSVQANGVFRQYAAAGYYSDFAYNGSTYNLGSSETTDNVDFKIAGGGTFTTGGGFGFWTQAGGATPIQRMRITSGGALQVKSGDSSETISVYTNVSTTNWAFSVGGSGTINGIAIGASSAATMMRMNKDSGSTRSLNAAGTLNASGADYAEYMIKAIDDIIAKGDVVGVNSNGLLTNVFIDSISFAVKSSDPSFVGNDTWGADLEIEALEAARIKVDRIAFSGQVPCNVYDANVGDYIIPIDDNGKIKGQAITNPTFEQYQLSVGKVWKIMEDGRAWIAVKIG